MKALLKSPAKITTAVLWSFFLLPFICLGQVYHVDPNDNRSNESRSMVSKNENADVSNKIIIRNNYSSAVTVLISSDNKSWDTLQIKEKNYISIKEKSLYLKVYTSATNYKLYQLAAGSNYQLYWSRDEKLWQLVK